MLTETTQPAANGGTAEQTRSSRWYRPSVDILERNEELVLLVDLPGVLKDGIEIDYRDGKLTIQGRAPERQSGSITYLQREYGVGDFHRTFQVTEHVDPSRITAEYTDGVLTLRLPKAEAAKPRKIVVNPK